MGGVNPHSASTPAEGCAHENVKRLAPIYYDGRPLYKCLDCGSRFTYQDDEPSSKGLAPVRLDAGQPWLRTHDGHDVGDPDWESKAP